MKHISLCIALSLIVLSTPAQDFRKANWGDSQRVVKASEPDVEWIEDRSGIFDVILFETTVAGLSAYTIYVFVEDKLVRARYTFAEEHSNRNNFIADFDKIGESLSTKYGNVERDEYWNDDLYKDDPSDWGMAIAVGHYSIFQSWKIENKTTITHMLKGDNYEIQHVLEYASIALEDFVEQKSKEADADVF